MSASKRFLFENLYQYLIPINQTFKPDLLIVFL